MKSKKPIINKLDKVWAKLIKARANEKCELCRMPGRDSHHIEGRIPQLLRWELANGIFLCFQCHRLGVHNPASSVQRDFRNKITLLKGKAEMERLEQMRYKQHKYSLSDLEDLYEKFNLILNELIRPDVLQKTREP